MGRLHAWIEVDGRLIGEGGDTATAYTVLFTTDCEGTPQ